jgi:hypothetical protein
MAKQAMLAGIPHNNIEVIGSTSFDSLFLEPKLCREDYLTSIGLDPKKKTILYAGGVLLTQSIEVIDILIRNKIIEDCNFIYRPYPHKKVLELPLNRVIEGYLFDKKNVYINDSNSMSNLIDLDIKSGINESVQDEKDIQIKYSDVIINHFSTFGLEACVLNKPVIQIGYDGPSMYAIQQHVHPTINMKQLHNVKQINFGASSIVKSDYDLCKAIQNYIDDPELNCEERRNYAIHECGFLDGKSTSRMMDLLKEV